MFIVGLTGSIGMGKTTAANAFRELGIPVHDADRVVHDLLLKNKAVFARIQKIFPETVLNGTINRNRLGNIVFNDAKALKQLENIIHPAVRNAEHSFLAKAGRRRDKLVVLDIPLLFETGHDKDCDAVCVVTCPVFLQKQRVMSRPGMTEEKFLSILKKQMPDVEKCKRADMLIQTGLGRAYGLVQIKHIINKVSRLTGKHWPNINIRSTNLAWY